MVDISFLKEYLDQLIVVEDTEDLKISYIEKHSDLVFVSFSSTPPDNTEIHEQFITTLTDKGVTGVYVMDKKSSYGNNIDWSRVADVVKTIANGRKMVSVGYCMGGTLAIAATKHLPIYRVLAITPQYSIHPSVLPKDSFLNRWAEQIVEWKMPSLDGHINNKTTYFIAGTNNYDDVIQMDMFPDKANVQKIIFKTDSHDLPGEMGNDLQEFMFDLIKLGKIKKKIRSMIVE